MVSTTMSSPDDNDTKEESSTAATTGGAANLPSSPAARAFFAALDASSSNSPTTSVAENQDGDNDNNKKKKQSSSGFIQKRIQTLGWRNRYSQDEYFPIDIGGTKFKVLQVQRGELENTYGTGATVWPASIVMAKYLERNAEQLVRGKRVVDLGAGTGITSIAAALLGATYVACTDGESKVVDLARDNIRRVVVEDEEGNGNNNNDNNNDNDAFSINGCQIRAKQYWWGVNTHSILGSGNGDDQEHQDPTTTTTIPSPCDVVIVSDCVLPKLYPIGPLVDAIDQLLVKPNAFALLSYEQRYYPDYDPKTKFQDLARIRNLIVKQVPLEQHHPIYSVDDIEIWRVERK